MSNKNIVRTSNPKDLRSIYQIEKDVFGSEHWTYGMIANELVNGIGKATWVIEEPPNILGYCMSRSFENEVNILNMAIKSSSQGKRVGRYLLEHILSQVPTKSSVFLEVKQGNLNAIKLYKSLGFQEISLRSSYYKDGTSALVMCLEH